MDKSQTVNNLQSQIDEKTKELMSLIEEKNKHKGLDRYSFYPIHDTECFKYYKTHESTMWSSVEINYNEDIDDYFHKLTDNDRKLIDRVISFFILGDGAITENLTLRFMTECESYEELAFFTFQSSIETVHAETYALFALTFAENNENILKERISKLEECSYIDMKMSFIKKYTYGDYSIAERRLAFACSEGIFFSNLFLVPYFYDSIGLLHAFAHANKLISRDESLHREFNNLGFRRNKDICRCSDERAYEIIKESVDIEFKFIEYILEEPIRDLTIDKFKDYCMSVADNLSVEAGLSPIYNKKNPFSWLDNISMQPKTNFYERDNGRYNNFDLNKALNWKDLTKNKDNKIRSVAELDL
jgi:ribonucleotide reductase beta subunit family protein with ferritin-like domain